MVTRHTQKLVCETCGKEIETNHKCDSEVVHLHELQKLIGDAPKLTWDEQFKNVLIALENRYNILISGGAGVGKSTMIREISKHYSVISTASTGISAVNINGATIDSTLRLNDSQKDFKENMKSIKTQLDKVDNEEDDEEKIRELHLMKSDILVIDEISMIDGVKFDEIIERINILMN